MKYSVLSGKFVFDLHIFQICNPDVKQNMPVSCTEEVKPVISSNSPLPEYLFCTYYNSNNFFLE